MLNYIDQLSLPLQHTNVVLWYPLNKNEMLQVQKERRKNHYSDHERYEHAHNTQDHQQVTPKKEGALQYKMIYPNRRSLLVHARVPEQEANKGKNQEDRANRH
jgi:hypothetical protein